MEEKKGQSFLREEDVLFVFNNEGKRSLPVREAPWDTLSVEKGRVWKVREENDWTCDGWGYLG